MGSAARSPRVRQGRWWSVWLLAGGLLAPLAPSAAGPGASPAAPGQVVLEDVRTWPAPDHTRLVFDTSGPVAHTVFRLDSPERVVIDLVNTRLARPIADRVPADNQVRRLRTAVRGRSDLRVVLDLKRPVHARSFLLRPNPPHGDRLVIDLESTAASHHAARAVSAPRTLRDVVVAIDPGHGGQDPGAIGSSGVREKDVTLRVARRLRHELRDMRGFASVLTRTRDEFVPLRARIERARAARADLFVSIHADAFRDHRVKGSSVYVLSRNGASSEAAKWLADQENAADLVGGVRLDDKDGLLASVLLDLSQAATLSASGAAGSRILRELNGLGKLHKREVQRAGFVVLKAPDVPSVLIETGYITNPDEERRLRDPAYELKLAQTIARGIREYFEKNAPEGSLLATRSHVIVPGDTLSHISAVYQVSQKLLRSENQLESDELKVGQVLRIPEG